MAISKLQLALVHVAKSHLHLDDETYRDILHVQAGVATAKDLDHKGLEAVLARFAELGFSGRPDGNRTTPRSRRPPEPQDVTGELPTPGQQGLISHLWQDLGWRGERRIEFTKRVCGGHAWPQTRAEAAALIEALKSMVRRGYDQRTPRRKRVGA